MAETKQYKSQQISVLIKYLLTPLWIISILFAFHVNAGQSPKVSVFVKSEHHHRDYITGAGVELWLVNQQSKLGTTISTSIGRAKVTDRENIQHDYAAWETGLKFGYFSQVFIYGEFGFDMGELVFRDRDEDEDDKVFYTDSDFVAANRRKHDDSNNIDGYLGIGAGFRYQNIQLEAFSRIRQIDGEHWKANNQAYTGAKLSFVF